jgi:hypothetical protein
LIEQLVLSEFVIFLLALLTAERYQQALIAALNNCINPIRATRSRVMQPLNRPPGGKKNVNEENQKRIIN